MQRDTKPIGLIECIIHGKVNNTIFVISLTSLFLSSESEEMESVQSNSRHVDFFFVRREAAQFLKGVGEQTFLSNIISLNQQLKFSQETNRSHPDNFLQYYLI